MKPEWSWQIGFSGFLWVRKIVVSNVDGPAFSLFWFGTFIDDSPCLPDARWKEGWKSLPGGSLELRQAADDRSLLNSIAIKIGLRK